MTEVQTMTKKITTLLPLGLPIGLLIGLLGATGSVSSAQAGDIGAFERQRTVLHERLAQLTSDPIPTRVLEPCMNGRVSASGLYATQAEEDAALARAVALEGDGGERLATVGR
jgi:hypothetical protein